MINSSLSIQRKVYLALGTIFLLVLIVVVSIAVSSERNLSKDMVHSQLADKASGYLDTMNMLMISGAIGNREMVREKLLSDNNIVEARMLRNDMIDRMYGKGFPHEYPQDELDRRALAGETLFVEGRVNNEPTITYVTPIIAEADYRGTNCLICHQAKEGDILGSIRITYSMASLNQTINRNIFMMASAQAAMFVIALILLSMLLQRVVIRPIHNMHKTLEQMERESDLTPRAVVSSRDEIGRTASALNSMTQRFADSLHHVVQSSLDLEKSALQIEQSSQHSLRATDLQNQETTQMSAAIEQLHNSIQRVMANAEQSSLASSEAKAVAHAGVKKTDQATETIHAMNEAIKSTASVIANLDERSANVGSVLGVIKGIAEQTNLLALNAAIEAARAGDSGRGFAVVADEVRTLSQRTHESTQEIEQMIEQLQQEARRAVESMNEAQTTAAEGMDRVNEAAQALHSMTDQVGKMDTINQETLHRMHEQVTVGNEVNDSIERIGQHSIDSSESANETAKISKTLVTMAQQLSALVKQFRL